MMAGNADQSTGEAKRTRRPMRFRAPHKPRLQRRSLLEVAADFVVDSALELFLVGVCALAGLLVLLLEHCIG